MQFANCWLVRYQPERLSINHTTGVNVEIIKPKYFIFSKNVGRESAIRIIPQNSFWSIVGVFSIICTNVAFIVNKNTKKANQNRLA